MACSSLQLLCQDSISASSYCLDVPDINKIECSLIQNDCECPLPQANPDIAGIGVLVAFFVSALFTWISTFLCLLLEPREKPKRKNPIDEWWTKHICLPAREVVPQADLLSECFYRVTWSLSDQQLVTGIAILVASFKLFNEGAITAYHFTIARDLAFFSSNSHLLSLLALWSNLGTERKTKQKWRNMGQNKQLREVKRWLPVPLVTWWRFFCMATFLGLLMAATWISAYGLFDEWAACPARCIPTGRDELYGVPFAWAIATTYFLVTQYLAITLQLGERIVGRAENLRRSIREFNKSAQSRLRGLPLLRGIYETARDTAVLLRFYWFSESLELLEMLAWFIANCYWVFQNRQAASSVYGSSSEGRRESAKEDEWGFGQIVPLLLLMLPVMVFSSTYQELKDEERREKKRGEYGTTRREDAATMLGRIQTTQHASLA